MATAMAVTMIMSRGTSTGTLIPHSPRRNASNVRLARADSPGLQVKVNRVRRDHRAIRIRHVQPDHRVNPVCHKIKRCLQENPVR